MKLGLVLACAAALLAGGCSDTANGAPEGKVGVVATTGMVADLARVVGGEHVHVTALMGPGVDPHLFKASAGDLDRLRAADIVLYSGLHLEGKMTDMLRRLARKQAVVRVTDALPRQRLLALADMPGHHDPHVWFDVALWAEAIPAVQRALAKADPSHADDYKRNADAYTTKLLALHDEVRTTVATIPRLRRVLITSHDAFRYFGRAYDLEVRGLQGISTVVEAGVKDVQDLAELIGKRGIKAVFVETSVSPRAIRAVQEAVKSKGHNVAIGGEMFSDAMGSKPPEDTYVGMVRHNVATLVKALK